MIQGDRAQSARGLARKAGILLFLFWLFLFKTGNHQEANMWIAKKALRRAAACKLAVLAAACPFVSGGAVASAQDGKLPQVFGGAQVEQIYRIRLDRGDLLLESLLKIIQEHNIQDGAVLTAAGSLQQCTFHNVKTLAARPEQQFTTIQGQAMEILNINGIIAAGEPHLHMTLSTPKGAFGGHLEKGCRVLYRAELTIAKFSGPPLARTPNQEGVPVLGRK
jgi:predicted DNA-binding protein with PD1-like motif